MATILVDEEDCGGEDEVWYNEDDEWGIHSDLIQICGECTGNKNSNKSKSGIVLSH